jgi:hypothetical protein
MEFHFTEEQSEQIRIGHRLSSEGEHHLTLCPLCATAIWQSTHLKKAPGLVVTLGERICECCEGVAARHPEIFSWVSAVLSGQRLIAKLSA